MDREEHDRRVASDTAAYERQAASGDLNGPAWVPPPMSRGPIVVLMLENNRQWSPTRQLPSLAIGWARVTSQRFGTICLVVNPETGQVFASYRHGERVL